MDSLHCVHGITPAWAGKRLVISIPGPTLQDHPRMGGEKYVSKALLFLSVGSPPHGRGKVVYLSVSIFSARITPAWAGKRPVSWATGPASKDHPRMGGEKTGAAWRWLMITGSPPHGRGKEPRRPSSQDRRGITPAWAGKSRAAHGPQVCRWDHPRMGGEKRSDVDGVSFGLGSPPHGRGKVCMATGLRVSDGITPAWAGKSFYADLDQMAYQDHPRMGGEKYWRH